MVLNLHTKCFRAMSDRRSDTAHTQDTECLVLWVVTQREIAPPIPYKVSSFSPNLGKQQLTFSNRLEAWCDVPKRSEH